MHKFYIGALFIFMFCINSFPPLNNSSNQFYDSQHLPVSTKLKTQKHTIVIQSFSVSGYFVIWKDFRNDPNKSVIYKKTYDKDGNRL